MTIRGNRLTAAAVVSALAITAALTGCTPAGSPTAETTMPRSTASAMPSRTPTPSPTPSAAGPLDARSAWEACTIVADREYVSQNPGSEISPFTDNTTLQTDGDGNTVIFVSMLPPQPIEGVGSIVMICTMAGTADAPVVVKWTMKDV